MSLGWFYNKVVQVVDPYVISGEGPYKCPKCKGSAYVFYRFDLRWWVQPAKTAMSVDCKECGLFSVEGATATVSEIEGELVKE